MTIERIDGTLLRKAIIHAAFILRQNKKTVDALNVFPVPDGDTGTNMSLTMDQAAKELEKTPANSLKKVADSASWGSLMGARGNSGVILSQLFRGFAQGIPAGKSSISPMELAIAYKSGVDAAYRAVMRPVEGTILTVARETADKMISEAKRNNNLEIILQNTLMYGEKVLEKTPDMLKVLKESKVVDAGGKGLLFIIKGFLEIIKNPELESSFSEKEDTKSVKEIDYHRIDQEIEFMYCTELFIKGTEIDIESIKSELSDLGDSMIVIGTGDLVKLHVHTNNPDRVLGCSLKWGELSNIKIDNMKVQHSELIKSDESQTIEKVEIKEVFEEDIIDSSISVVAVSQGEGLNEIFKSMGADIIEGGQSMNPSTENILLVVEKKASKNIIVLPNNKNIILTAEQVKTLTKKNIHVIPTKSIPQGIAALLSFSPDLSIEENISKMIQSIENVVSGEVTYAIRDTKWNGTRIKEGDILGIKDGELLIVEKDKEQVMMRLIDIMTEQKQDGIITIYYGKDVNISSLKNTINTIEEKHKRFDVEYYSGGQSLYYYLVSVE